MKKKVEERLSRAIQNPRFPRPNKDDDGYAILADYLMHGKRHQPTKPIRRDIHIVVDPNVLKAAQIKCVEDDLVLSHVITALLEKWLKEKE